MESNKELYKRIADFMASSIMGVHIYFYKERPNETNDKQMKILFTANCLNNAWASLVQNKDTFIFQSISSILECMENESPRCLFHLFLKIATYSIENDTTEYIDNPNMSLEYLQTIHKQYIHQQCEKIAEAYIVSRGPHNCSGAKMDVIHEQNPAPIWTLKKVNLNH